MVLLNADWVNCGEVAKNYFVSQQCLNLQAKSGHEDEVIMDFVRQEIGIFNACEDCGKTYRVSSFNKDAPYAMCEMCYDNYLCNK